jgi:putative DNA primase/helicase
MSEAHQLEEIPFKEPRSFDELLEAAKALKPEQNKEMKAIISECTGLDPLDQDTVYRAIKGATKVPLGTIRQQRDSEGNERPDPDDLALAQMTIDDIGRENIICTNAFVWRWQDRGVWTEQHDRAIKKAVQARLQDEVIIDVSASRVNGVTDVLKTQIFCSEHEFNRGSPESVNCLNGEIELRAGRWLLRRHCREHFRTTQIPVEYDSSAEAPMFTGFLQEVFRDDPDRDDKAAAVLELMGYTLMSHARHEKFIMLIGPGANGKSVLLAVLEALLGSENVAGVQPANFNNSFQRAHLHQKLANIVTELKQGEVIADAELKAITSGEPATVEHKFKNPFVMRPFATCWFGTNHMPHTRDFSEALFRRATILQFNRVFAKSEQDPHLKDKLKSELQGILTVCLNAYARALANGFTEPQSSAGAKEEWRLEADQVAQFVDDACHRAPDAKTTARVVFLAYETWALNNGIQKTMSQKGLRDRLTRLGFGSVRDSTARYVTGLRVK